MLVWYIRYTFAVEMYDLKRIYRSFVAGDVRPFYKEMYPGLLVYATRQLGDELSYLAEDCVQDAVLDSYKERSRLKSPEAWYVWLVKCIYHGCLSQIRKNQSYTNYLDKRENQSHSPSFDMMMYQQEALDLLYSAINQLQPRYREVLRLTYFEGMKNKEIAERFGVAEITVKKWKASIIAYLRDILDDEFDKNSITGSDLGMLLFLIFSLSEVCSLEKAI